MLFPLTGPAYQTRSLNVQSDRMINLYPEVADNQVTALYPTPGLEPWIDFDMPNDGIRGELVAGVYLWVVCGTKLYRVAVNGSYIEIGTIAGAGRVGMAQNGLQLMIVTGEYGYIVTLAISTLQQITDPDFEGADWVDFQDGYFLFGRSNTQKFYVTAAYDGLNIDALDFASAEGNPDNVIRGLCDHRELWLFGDKSTEVHVNTGNSDFPYERVQGAYMEHGLASRDAAAKIDNSVFWLGADDKGQGMVWRAEGYSPRRISSHAVEYAISKYPRIDDAYAWTYQEQGHTFFILTFPSGNATWCYDAATGMWHELAWFNPANGQMERHRANSHEFFGGYHIVGDHSRGKLYRLRFDIGTDDGGLIRRVRQAGLPKGENKRQFFGRLELICESGVGLVTGHGEDPQAMLQVSYDGGHTWGNERWRSMGRIGEYGRRVYWNRCGSGRQITVRLVVTDPVPIAWIGVSAEIEEAAA